MSAKRKILTVVGLTLSTLTLIVVLIVTLNFRHYGIEAAIQKSHLTAELVRDALTTHMVNGWMDKRQFYLGQITNSQNIKNLWLVRSQTVIDQFGPSLYNEVARDKYDQQVIDTGKPVERLEENPKEALLRVTIPYTASSLGNPNCLQCHEAKDGEVLGAISMVFNISDVRYTGFITVLRIIGISVVFLLIGIFVTNYFINPYLELFEALTTSIKKADEGDFSGHIKTRLTDEGGEVAKWQNELYTKMQETVSEIDKKISILVTYDRSLYHKNPLVRSKEIISELTDIYKFKKTIELDSTKYDIYNRIISILTDKFGIDRFAMFETHANTQTREVIYASEKDFWCSPKVDADIHECRAHRTKTVIFSDDFKEVCENCLEKEGQEYVCIPYTINTEVGLTITVRPDDVEEIDRIKHLIPTIVSYLDAAKPVIESRLLTDLLKEQSLRDALTGLYNRKFLEEYIEKATHQALRAKTSYGVLMLDIDFFKMVNDTYGHDIGDIVISGLADTLKECVRDSDLAIRFGGEEFIVMLYNTTEEGTVMVAEKIRRHFEDKAFSVGKEKLKKTISIGVSMFPDDSEFFWKVIKFADLALYKAKGSGRNKVVRFDSSMAPEGEDY